MWLCKKGGYLMWIVCVKIFVLLQNLKRNLLQQQKIKTHFSMDFLDVEDVNIILKVKDIVHVVKLDWQHHQEMLNQIEYSKRITVDINGRINPNWFRNIRDFG